MFGSKNKSPQQSPLHNVPVPVLCKFWQEDGVWNATAEHIAVAVFGETFEEARDNMCNALISHFQNAEETGRLSELVTHLKRRADDRMLESEILPDSFVGRLSVPMDNEAEMALDCA